MPYIVIVHTNINQDGYVGAGREIVWDRDRARPFTTRLEARYEADRAVFDDETYDIEEDDER